MDRRLAREQTANGWKQITQGNLDAGITLLSGANLADPRNPLTLCHLGYALWKKKQFAEAEQVLRQACLIRPWWPGPRHTLALVYRDTGRTDQCIKLCRRILFFDGGNYRSAYITLAELLKSRGDTTAAIRVYKSAIRRFPSFAVLHNNLGAVYEAKGEFDKAARAYEKAIRLSPKYDQPKNNLAGLAKRREASEAQASAEAVVKSSPNDTGAHWALARAYHHGGLREQCAAQYRATLHLDPTLSIATADDVDLCYRVGRLLREKAELGDAIVAFRNALRLDPNHPGANLSLGNALDQQKDYDAAVEAYRACLAIDPQMALAYSNMGYTFSRIDKWDEAVEAWRKAIHLNPSDPRAHIGLGHSFAEQKLFKEAINHYREALSVDPSSFDARLALGFAYTQTGQRETAVEELRHAVRLQPGHGQAHAQLADALAARGDWRETVEECRAAIKAGFKNARLHCRLADALWNSRDLNGAVLEYRKAVRESPDFEPARRQLGDALFAKRKWQEALENYQKCDARSADDPEYFVKLGGCYADRAVRSKSADDWNLAREAFHHALEIKPRWPIALYGLSRVAWNMQDWGTAVSLLESAVAEDPSFTPAHAHLLCLHIVLGNWQDARIRLRALWCAKAVRRR